MQFLQLHLDPASGNTLPASSDGSITQKLRVSNNQHGKVCVPFFFPLYFVHICCPSRNKQYSCKHNSLLSEISRHACEDKLQGERQRRSGGGTDQQLPSWFVRERTGPLTMEPTLMLIVKKHPSSATVFRPSFVTSFWQSVAALGLFRVASAGTPLNPSTSLTISGLVRVHLL